jgi:hypothetical protein
VAATGNPQALFADYQQHSSGELANFIGRTLRLTAGICARDQPAKPAARRAFLKRRAATFRIQPF